MMVVDRRSGDFRDSMFAELPGLLRPGDVLVVNNTRVFPARLLGRTDTGGRVELLLSENLEGAVWIALARPAKRLKPGRKIFFDDSLEAVVVGHDSDAMVRIEFIGHPDVWTAIEKVGHTPLPHYVKRDEHETDEDRERYQTVYAKQRGAIAAPTAGFHFTSEMMNAIAEHGVEIVEITLHVGYGTFEPVRVEDLSKHRVLAERFEITAEAAARLTAAKRESRRLVAVGTTTTRALESAAVSDGVFEPIKGRAELTVTPGYEFRAVDALLTNFHLPKSSLLILVSTFGGHELIMKAYEHAVAESYRFYSYGDCMFIE